MKKELVGINMVSFIIHTIISIRLLTLPSDIAEKAGNNGWASVILTGTLTFFIGYIFYWLCVQYPGLNISQIYKKIYGKILGSIILIGIFVYNSSSIGLGLRLFGEGIKIFLLDKTPLTLVLFLMLASCLYCLLKGIKTISIVLDILLIPTLLSMVILIFISLTNIKPGNLLPFFSKGFMPVLKGSLELTDPFVTVGIIGYIVPYFKSVKGLKKYIYIGIGISVLIYLLITIVAIMNFGKDELDYILFPTIALTKSIRLQNIFERAESLYMAIWIPVTFTTLLLYYFASTLNLKALFNSKSDFLIIYLQFVVFLTISLLPENIAQLFKYIDIKEKFSLMFYYLILPLTFIVALIKRRQNKN